MVNLITPVTTVGIHEATHKIITIINLVAVHNTKSGHNGLGVPFLKLRDHCLENEWKIIVRIFVITASIHRESGMMPSYIKR